MTAIAFLGLGRMGTPMARRLVDAGHELAVWNRTPTRLGPLVTAGARAASTPADAAGSADVVITMLTDGAALRDVVLGPDGVAKGIRPEAVLVDMSTVGPATINGLAAELPTSFRLVDAPVSGSVDQATAGTLAILAGGDTADVDAVEPVLAAMGLIDRCGALGMGAAAKLVSIATRIAAMTLVGEARSIAASFDLPDGLTAAVLADSPLASILQRLERPGAHYTLDLAAKDLRLALANVDSSTVPVGSAVLDRASRAAAADGGRDVRTLASPTRGAARRPIVTMGNPEGVTAPLAAYSHAVRLELGPGSLLVLSGQIAVDDDGNLVGEGDLGAQSRRVFEIVEAILRAHGASLDDVVNIRTYLTDIGRLPEYGAVRRELFTSTPPTSTTVEVPRLFRPGALVEVEVSAAIPA